MRVMKRIMVPAAILLLPLVSHGQKINDVTYRLNDEGVVVIDYRFTGRKIKSVNAYMSVDDGPYKLLRNVTGDVGTVKGSGMKRIYYDVLQDYPDKTEGDIAFMVRGWAGRGGGIRSDRMDPCFWLEFNGSFYGKGAKSSAIGFTMGYCETFGGYLRMMFQPETNIFTKGVPPQGVQKELQGTKIQTFTAGPMFQAAENLFLFTGIGYGAYGEYFEENKNDYGYSIRNYMPVREVGMAFEAGAMVRLFGYVSLSCSYGATVAQKYRSCVTFGIGLAAPSF